MIGIGMAGPIGASLAGAVGAGIGIGAGGFYGGWDQASRADPIVNQSINRGTESQRGFMDVLLGVIPPTALAQAILYGGTGETFGSIAQGDPSGGGPMGGTGLENVAPVSRTAKAIQAVVNPPTPPVQPRALSDDRKRKRFGRQETILTSRSALSDAPTVRPTLLGQ